MARTIFDRIREHERSAPDKHLVMLIPPEQVSRVAREIRDSIPVLRTGEQAFEWDMKSAVMGGKIRIGKTTLKVIA